MSKNLHFGEYICHNPCLGNSKPTITQNRTSDFASIVLPSTQSKMTAPANRCLPNVVLSVQPFGARTIIEENRGRTRPTQVVVFDNIECNNTIFQLVFSHHKAARAFLAHYNEEPVNNNYQICRGAPLCRSCAGQPVSGWGSFFPILTRTDSYLYL